jgi:surfactin family lipopeptide synthetase A
MKLSLPQKDIYFEQLIFPDEPIYNIGAKILIEGFLDKKVFEQAYISLIQQHDAYRNYLRGDIDTVEMISTDEIRPLEFSDFSNEKNSEKMVLNFMQKEFKKAFDIKKDKFLYRFVLIKIKENVHYLFSVYHHIITDGWGASLMFRRLVSNYNEILEYGDIKSEYSYTYEDFVVEDEKYFTSKDFQEDKVYWKDKFKILPENSLSKIDQKKTINKNLRKEFIINRDIFNALIHLSTETKSTTFHIILAILYAYLGKKYQNEFISVGLPILNRSGVKFKKTVGLFMGMNSLLITIDQEETFVELIEKIKKQLRQDYRHQRFPLGQLVKELGAFHQKEKLFNITLSYEKQDYSPNFLDTITQVIPLSHESERVALAIYIREFDDTKDVKVDFDYNINYFTEESISQVIQHFEILLKEVLIAPQKKIKELNYLTEGERHQLLVNFNDTKVDYPKDKTIVDLFEEQVKKTPDSIAIKDSKRGLTYLQLKEESDKIASYLLSKHGGLNEPVGVLMDRSVELVVLLLGIFKSGRSYIPIDPTLPEERIDYIIQQSLTTLIITESLSLDYVSFTDNKEKVIFITKDELFKFEAPNNEISKYKPYPADTAYIIYTSGSTGNPKGVEIGHQSLTNFLTSIQHCPGIKEQDILYSVTTYSFDISILEFFTPLISGATVFIAEKETLKNMEYLIAELEQVKPSIVQATPSFYQMLFNAGWRGDKNLKILCGGDSLNELLTEKLISHSKEVWNMYGPTETTIWSSLKKIEKPSDASNIGKPINNTQIYIVDKNLHILPKDTVGRIFIAGDGLAKGYYKNKELTSEKFIPNPFEAGARMYDTGDLARWLPDGNIEFLGRNDFQVKIRGYRIELGEIETHLSQYSDNIKQVVAEAKEVNGEKMLVAYYTINKGSTVNKTALREYLQSKLPEYMVPGFFVEMESIPLTPNGKIDRKSLPYITSEDIIRKTYVAPRNETEQKLAEIWQEVLEIDKVGITDNFFELGGHSLVAGKIANKISQNLNIEVSLKHIFQNDTVENLTKVIEKGVKREEIIPQAQFKEYYPITPGQKSIWIASQKDEYSDSYNMYAIFEIKGEIDLIQLEKSFSKLIQEKEIFRTNFIERQGEIYQFIRAQNIFEIDYFEAVSTLEIKDIIKNYVSRKFDLETDTLIKTGIFENKEGVNYLVFLTHHIIVDGISLEILFNELINIYSNSEADNISKIQFKDYSEWLYTSINERESDFWKLYLEKAEKTKLIFNNSINQGFLKEKQFCFSSFQYFDLKELAQKNRTTIYTVIFTCIGIVLSKIYEQSNICIGTVFSGRNYKQIEDSIGMFIKTLPCQISIDEKLDFSSLVKECQDNLLLLEENINIPFVNNLNILTDFLIGYHHSNTLIKSIVELNSFSLKRVPLHFTKSRFPIVFNFYENSDLKCEIEYDEYVDESVLDTIWEKTQILLSLIINTPDAAIKQFDLSTSKEIQLRNSTDISFDF